MRMCIHYRIAIHSEQKKLHQILGNLPVILPCQIHAAIAIVSIIHEICQSFPCQYFVITIFFPARSLCYTVCSNTVSHYIICICMLVQMEIIIQDLLYL